MAKTDPIIVVIEDDASIRRFLSSSLSRHGFMVYEAETGKQGVIEAGRRKPDLLILDLGLPDIDGIRVIRSIREWSAVPIIVLSARNNESQKIEALDAGANDYLTKPFGFGELRARIRVALRHAFRVDEHGQHEIFQTANIKIDLLNRIVSLDDQPIHLTPIQYRLLSVLTKHAGKVLTHQQILKEVWGPSHQENAHYLRIYMSQLRQKLEANPTQPRILLTESGVGYRLQPSVNEV
jgi:two-component system KDP operon response regulator KdpE